MATLATQSVSLAGLNPSFAAAAGGGDRFRPGPKTFVEVVNGGGSPINVTIDSKQLSNFGTDVNVVVAVPAGQRRRIGPLPVQRFASGDGLGDITYSGTTDVTVGVFG